MATNSHTEVVVTLTTTRGEVLDRFIVVRRGPLCEIAQRVRDLFTDWAGSHPGRDRIFIEE